MRRFGWILLLMGLLTFGAAARAEQGLRIHFIALGRVDAILIECDGESAFIDAGFRRDGLASVKYIKGLGVEKLTYYIGTHAHSDHVGGGGAVIAALHPEAAIVPHGGVRRIVLGNAEGAEKKAVEATPFRVFSRGMTMPLGEATLKCLGPIKVVPASSATSAENHNSLVFQLFYGGKSYLFTGDAPAGELAVIERKQPGSLKSDVFKSPHHNAGVSSDVVRAIRPELTIFCTGNTSLPSGEYKTALRKVGSRLYAACNWDSGNVVLESMGAEIRVVTGRCPESLALNKDNLTVYEGKSAALAYEAKPKRKVALPIWTTDDGTIATVNYLGEVKGLRAGTTVVRARWENGAGDEAKVTVLPATLSIKPATLSIKHRAGAALQTAVKPAGAKIGPFQWTSSDESIVYVGATGRIRARLPGEAVITATAANGQTARARITVVPIAVKSLKLSSKTLSLKSGETQRLRCAVAPNDASYPTVEWLSLDEEIATVDQYGRVTGLGIGETTIRARVREGKQADCAVTVRGIPAKTISLSGPNGPLVCGLPGRDGARIAVQILPANATNPRLLWTSSDGNILLVDETGYAHAVGVGTARLTATARDGGGARAYLDIAVVENAFFRPAPLRRAGEFLASAKSLRYAEGVLEVALYYANDTPAPQTAPQAGMLCLLFADGRRLPLLPIDPLRVTGVTVAPGGVGECVFSVPLAPAWEHLDLRPLDAAVDPL